MDRLLEMIYGDSYSSPLWLVLSHHYSLAFTGIANAIVWRLNRRIQPTKSNKTSNQTFLRNNGNINEKNVPLISNKTESNVSSEAHDIQIGVELTTTDFKT